MHILGLSIAGIAILAIFTLAAIGQWDVEKELGGNLFSFCFHLPGAVIDLLKGITLTIWGKLRKVNETGRSSR